MREKFSYFNLHDQAGQSRSFFLNKELNDSGRKKQALCRSEWVNSID